MLPRLAIVLLLLAATLVTPFLLRPDDRAEAGSDARRLIIISPHNESIRSEFAAAFERHMREQHGQRVRVDWRQPGGTAEIAMFLKSEYASAFEYLWERETGTAFDLEARAGFANPKIDPATAVPDDQITARAIESRRRFLESDVTCGIDLFFGGGAYDFDIQARAGALVARDASGKYGLAALNESHPEWFADTAIPAGASGEPFRDPDWRWCGTVLSAFGICYNEDSLARLGFAEPPNAWEDLGDPRFFGQIAMADPTKSGSVTKAVEMIFQQEMRRLLDDPARASDPNREARAVAEGWDAAMRLILKISANSRYWTDQASKIPHDVAQGDAAAGMCIDFYGRTFNELHRQPDGSSRVQFVMPTGGTSIGADPIGLLRGAPDPELAHRFMEFVLSPDGQKIWNYRRGEPGGPTRISLRRPPIRRDFYSDENRRHMSDPEVNPYEIARGFTYEAKWTGSVFNALRFIIRCTCVDTHREQRDAWRAIIDAGFPPEAVAVFEQVDAISHAQAAGPIADTLKAKDKIREVELARELAAHFREQYRRAAELARAGR
ncbi:MAG: extracellular solute-binding protein [Verrucomicrobiales bacterium]|nr:extracellular solute-binding protein [Verrucomicrobiales bacterium]